MLTLHCPPTQLYALGSFLREHGADTVSIASLDYVLDRENPYLPGSRRSCNKAAVSFIVATGGGR
jgi:hypothetical protein